MIATLIPNLPHPSTELLMRTNDGKTLMHPDWHNYFSQLNIALQTNFSAEGFKLPLQTAANIAALNTAQSIGALIYDKENHLGQININGTFKTLATL